MMTSGCDLAEGKMDKSPRLLAKNIALEIRSCTYAIHDVPSKPIRIASDRLGGCGE